MGLFARVKIRTKLVLLVCLFVAGFAGFGLLASNTIGVIKVNGPVYKEIVAGKDLIADILPPPEYIIESYLTVLQLVGEAEKGGVQEPVQKLKKLKEEYLARHDFWSKEIEEGTMKATLIADSYQPAMEFYDLLDKEFVPAVVARDANKARSLAYGALKSRYDQHRAAIDQVVKLAADKNAADEERAAAFIRSRSVILFAVGIATVVFSGLAAYFLIGNIVRPLHAAAGIASRLAEGDLSAAVDQENDADTRLTDEAGIMLRALKEMNARLLKIVTDVRTSAQAVNSSASEISSGNLNLSQRTQEQASALEETASSMEEMTSTVKQNADNALKANQLAAGARGQAERGGEVVFKAIEAMDQISAAARKMSDIIGVIDEIAFQTNLLALNAAVEAARAGEQGRGFSVVAAEVRTLAQRSASAAKEIKELIKNSVEKVEAGSKLVDESGATLSGIVESVKKVTDIVAEIAAASAEQSSGIEQVSRAVVQMDEMTQQNAALVEEAAAASHSMEEQARGLDEIMTFFKLETGAASGHGPAAAPTRNPAAAPGKVAVLRVPPARRVAQARPGPAPARTARASEAGGEGMWEEF